MLFLPSAVPWELSQDMFNEKAPSRPRSPQPEP